MDYHVLPQGMRGRTVIHYMITHFIFPVETAANLGEYGIKWNSSVKTGR
jgi:hypothetical protein